MATPSGETRRKEERSCRRESAKGINTKLVTLNTLEKRAKHGVSSSCGAYEAVREIASPSLDDHFERKRGPCPIAKVDKREEAISSRSK